MRFMILTSLASAMVGLSGTAAGAVTLTLVPLHAAPTVAQFTMQENCPVPERPAAVSDMIVQWPTLAAQQLPAAGFHAESALRVAIDANGKAESITILNSSGNTLLDSDALRAARSAKFSAETSNCHKVGGEYKLLVDYDN
jgi:TonB family protein